MHSFVKSCLLVAVLVAGAYTAQIHHANAEVFVVEDQKNRFSLSFPDRWSKVTNQLEEDKLTILAPGENAFASCRVRVRSDERFVSYPAKYDRNIQHIYISDALWDDYLSDYSDIEVEKFRDDAGLGFGHASMVEASYETVDGAIMRKKALMFASLYHNRVFIVDCSAEIDAYDHYREAFLNVMSSVDFKKVTHEHTSGHYRDFTQETLEVQGPREMDVYKY